MRRNFSRPDAPDDERTLVLKPGMTEGDVVSLAVSDRIVAP
ncbi:hypothetical protein [Saccharomonospora xinjiangensis]|nr:hypothetical protein [Saccharomonospora xinjiangensis]